MTPIKKYDKLFKRPTLSGIFPSKSLKDAEKNTSNERFPKKLDSSYEIVFGNPKKSKLGQKAKLHGNFPNKFVVPDTYQPKFRAVGQVGWNFSSQRVICKIELSQSEQLTNFFWNFTIEAIVSKVDGPKKGEVANVRGNGATQVMTW